MDNDRGKGSAKNRQLASLFPTTVSTVSGAEGLSQCWNNTPLKYGTKLIKNIEQLLFLYCLV